MIIVSQFFGLFPISLSSSNDPTEIKFSWKSFRFFFSLSFVITSAVVAVSFIRQQTSVGNLTPTNIAGFVFYGNCLVTSIFFFKLSTKFSLFIQRWMNVEDSLKASYLYESLTPTAWSLKRRVCVSSSVAMVLALLEHLLSLAVHRVKTNYEVDVCNWTRNSSFIENFISKHLYFIFNFIEYNHIYGFVAEYFNVSCTFLWSFLDIFIMIVSIGLAYNFELINNRIEYFQGRAMPESVWIEVRRNYSQVCELLQFVDEELEKIIILACWNDAYFIIIQLMHISRFL